MECKEKSFKVRLRRVALLLTVAFTAFALAFTGPQGIFRGQVVHAQTEEASPSGQALDQTFSETGETDTLPDEESTPEQNASEEPKTPAETPDAALEEPAQPSQEATDSSDEMAQDPSESDQELLETQEEADENAGIAPQDDSQEATELIPIYRLYNPDNYEHLFTSDANEKETLHKRYGWGYEGIAWYSQSSGTPVYRLYQPWLRNHLYTTDQNEINVLQSRHGWRMDNNGQPLFYSSGSVPIYRVYNQALSGLHHWTTDGNEYSVLSTRGWSPEGEKFYAAQLGAPSSYTDYWEASQVQGNPSVPGKFGWVAGKRTLKNALLTALQPVGNTLYILGGGWNQIDAAASWEARTLGVSGQWQNFFNSQNASYNYERHLYEIRNGLDCSGFMGWVVYNIRNTTNNQPGYVYGANRQARIFANMGLGSYTPPGLSSRFTPGDIVSMEREGHVYMVIGQCPDGSVVLVHSSPPGVMISGTKSASGGETQATRLANTYMSRYFPEYYRRYASQINRGNFYKTGARFTWGDRKLNDPEGLRNMNAEQVLKNLFNEN